MAFYSLWHGSSLIIEKPEYGKGKSYNDYGTGFYCTEYEELAKEWACSGNSSGFANHYILPNDDLTELNLQSGSFTILHWLTILAENRRFQPDTAVAAQGLQYLKKHFHIDTDKYDLIRGYRADDSYFSFAKAFVGNAISLTQLFHVMHLGKLGEQIMLKSECAFSRIQFCEAVRAEAGEYFVKRRQRDEAARSAFQLEALRMDLNGIFMRDIIRERIKPEDERLQSVLCGKRDDHPGTDDGLWNQ